MAATRPFREEAEVIYLWRDDFANLRITLSRPAGYPSTRYRKEAVVKPGATEPEPTVEEFTKVRKWPPMDRAAKVTTRQPALKTKAKPVKPARKKAGS